jgi:hypothetical protein
MYAPSVVLNMKSLQWLFLVFAAIFVLVGCGGGSSGAKGEISGSIVDVDGNPVRGARVEANGRVTQSNSAGVYVLRDVEEGAWSVVASIIEDGVTYSGETVVEVFGEDRAKSVNIAVSNQADHAHLYGIVRDRFGNALQGAKVFGFLLNEDGFTLSSVMDITNGLGEYDLRRLVPGYTYIINGGGRGYGSDRDTVILDEDESRRFDITLGEATDPLLDAPDNLSAVAWTTPSMGNRSPAAAASLMNAIKQRIDTKFGTAQRVRRGTTRLSTQGNHIEVDLYWDAPTTNLSQLLGYGIYRATSANGSSVAIDFHRDPESIFYQDLDDALLEDRNYYYEITALSNRYPDTGNSESDFSNRYGVRTLGDMNALPVTQGPITFRWEPAVGAEEYYVFLFAEEPQINVTEIWSNEVGATGTSVVYPGSLISGKRYYYIVLGVANDNDSRTISPVESFVAN